jgi:hypothetical protein
VRWFRRHDETLNEQLLREAGLDDGQTEEAPPMPAEPADPYAGTVVHEGRRTLRIDGIPSTLDLPALHQEGDYALHGSRLDGDLWEIQVNAL